MGATMNRRGFLLGLGALVAAPAVIRVAQLMPISTRLTPAYVPIDWLKLKYGMEPFPLDEVCLSSAGIEPFLKSLKAHGWSKPMADNWIDLNDFDPGYVQAQLALAIDRDWFRGYA